ncbi:BZ3500_MvSof-1268-A1-R1_Chr5-3g08343 [Microbotryum saponariae]|uniref:BZ3500_MvSof-1268-A1-R1_Chr5-3g08343 protein n=1 Tax=Microbotryum saponariae TaxID=289078 RepID=A0A2X0LMS4_9BASI|nr:BZ3500_MvSof-1268-A1-R1_Chr5-3g08343 [Microbotryum saponariae]SDA08451.1 BZ3501_MvSof-1269-A2-R1_Chr5-3g08071 [Microbotryum saponariae]
MSTRMMGPLRSFPSLRSQLRLRFTPICSDSPRLLCPRFRDASPLQQAETVKLGRHLQSPKLDVDDLTDKLQGLTCAVQDTTIVARALAALEKSFAREFRCGGDQAAVADDSSLPKLGIQEQLYGPDLEEKLFRDMMSMDNLPLVMSPSILDAVKFLWDDPDLKLTNSGPTEFPTVVVIDFEDFELKYNKRGLTNSLRPLGGFASHVAKRWRSSFPGVDFQRP